MNLEAELDEAATPSGQPDIGCTADGSPPESADTTLDIETPPGVYRALVDLKNWHPAEVDG